MFALSGLGGGRKRRVGSEKEAMEEKKFEKHWFRLLNKIDRNMYAQATTGNVLRTKSRDKHGLKEKIYF